MKRKLLFLSFALLMVFAAACESSSDQTDSITPLATEKVFPDDFFEEQTDGVLIDFAENDEEMNASWSYFNLSNEPGEINWKEKSVLFLGIFESGSCPVSFDEASAEDGLLTVALEIDGKEACTDDATPRTIVLELPKDMLTNVEKMKLSGYHGLEPEFDFKR